MSQIKFNVQNKWLQNREPTTNNETVNENVKREENVNKISENVNKISENVNKTSDFVELKQKKENEIVELKTKQEQSDEDETYEEEIVDDGEIEDDEIEEVVSKTNKLFGKKNILNSTKPNENNKKFNYGNLLVGGSILTAIGILMTT